MGGQRDQGLKVVADDFSRSTLLVLLVEPSVWPELTGRWFSLGTVLCLVPLQGFVIDHYRVTRAYNRCPFAPIALDS